MVQSHKSLVRRSCGCNKHTGRAGYSRSILKDLERVSQADLCNQFDDLLGERRRRRLQRQLFLQFSKRAIPYEQIGDEGVVREAPDGDGRKIRGVVLFIRDDGSQELQGEPQQDLVYQLRVLREKIEIGLP